MSIYFVNMQKDIGRKKWIDPLCQKLGGTIWNGIDVATYDDHGILIKSCDIHVATRAAKCAKIKLFEHFLLTSPHQYLILFEDDIIIHKKFYEYYDLAIKFANTNDFKLIYFGVSSGLIPESTSSLIIKPLQQRGYRYSGAYGVIIHRSIINKLILRSNDPTLLMKPFDVYSLGYIQECYPSLCFVCHPQIVIPDITTSNIRDPRNQHLFWKMSHLIMDDYIIPSQLPMFILTNTNERYIRRFIKLLQMFVPYVKPIFMGIQIPECVQNVFESIIIPSYNNDIITSTIQSHIKNIKSNGSYILTNIYTNWTSDINTENIFNIDASTSFIIDICPRCKSLNNKEQICDINMLNGFQIIISGINNVIKKQTNKIYNVSVCTCSELFDL